MSLLVAASILARLASRDAGSISFVSSILAIPLVLWALRRVHLVRSQDLRGAVTHRSLGPFPPAIAVLTIVAMGIAELSSLSSE